MAFILGEFNFCIKFDLKCHLGRAVRKNPTAFGDRDISSYLHQLLARSEADSLFTTMEKSMQHILNLHEQQILRAQEQKSQLWQRLFASHETTPGLMNFPILVAVEAKLQDRRGVPHLTKPIGMKTQ
jgi:hypothetical protein